MRGVLSCISSIALALTACSSGVGEGTVSIAVIGEEEGPFETGNRLSYAGQLAREATSEGLVAMDAQGNVIPALAERWIVTEDGLSFFFRIRSSEWPDGTDLNATSVRRELLRTVRSFDGTTLGLDLAKVDEVRVMADRVLEVRLKSPMPQFLQLLAQPELGLLQNSQGTGPMRAEGDDEEILRLTPVPPQLRGLPERSDWDDGVLEVSLHGMPAQEAVDSFRDGDLSAVVNGRLAAFPLAELGPLSSGTLRLDPALGLFGLAFRNNSGLLAQEDRREALSMAIDRDTLLQPFNLAGWIPTTRIVAPGLPGDRRTAGERWSDQTLEERQTVAAGRVSAWETASGEQARLTIALPGGPGAQLLLQQLAEDWAAIGVELVRAEPGQAADLMLVDRLARYAGARWFLNQFNCDISQPICSPDADVFVDQSLDAASADEAANLLASAEVAMNDSEVFIPLGAPIRWSLVRGGLDGFFENSWGRHPLFAMATAPIS